MNPHIAHHYLLSGHVQGVGFRPYVYRLAKQHGLVGWVKNLTGQVDIRVQGHPTQVLAFATDLLKQAPPLANPKIVSEHDCPVAENLTTFEILASGTDSLSQVHVPPDYFTCDDCLNELHTPTDRRYRYPFINCTQCGPRYTLIVQLPYDRPHTSMAAFPLCPACLAEYENPANRRFHAQPLACPECGPQLSFRPSPPAPLPRGEGRKAESMVFSPRPEGEGQGVRVAIEAFQACVQALRNGEIVAVKGIGGYHLCCLARHDEAVLRLREKKPRPAKPLAVLFPWQGAEGLDAVNSQVELDPLTVAKLRDPSRPIVLMRKRQDCSLSPHLAPGVAELGVMLPYSPLHHLLLEEVGEALVATSANVSGEPVLTDNEEVERRLPQVAEAFLHHNRPIVRPADDSVWKLIAGKLRPVRLGRGYAPLELTLPTAVPQPLLAVGGHLKNTIALAWENRVVISPHIGDLDSARSLDVFGQVVTDLQKLYHVQAHTLVCDAHPQYASTRWAKRSGLPLLSVFHHHAHASALVGEFFDSDAQGKFALTPGPSPPGRGAGGEGSPWLIFTWDGVGLGPDGTLWGGEALYGFPGQWQRVASFRPFYLPGGDKAGREPWRSAVALCWETQTLWATLPIDTTLLYQVWQRRVNCPQTTAVGRLFDAAAALTGVLHTTSFEGQGPMWLEAICNESTEWIALPIEKDASGKWQTDWGPLVSYLLNETFPVEQRATVFHNSLAQALLAQIRQVSSEYPIGQIGLSGGVFQNCRLTETVVQLLREVGMKVYLAEQVPGNDAGISFGQIVEVLGRF